MKIRVFYDDTGFRLESWRKLKKLIVKVIEDEKLVPGDLNFIFTTDKTMLEINKEFLKHSYYTDVISFTGGVEGVVSGEVYIGIETVKANAKNYKVSYNEEVIRVLIHGTLHLCGYEDDTSEERELMSSKEEFWINKYELGKNEF